LESRNSLQIPIYLATDCSQLSTELCCQKRPANKGWPIRSRHPQLQGQQLPKGARHGLSQRHKLADLNKAPGAPCPFRIGIRLPSVAIQISFHCTETVRRCHETARRLAHFPQAVISTQYMHPRRLQPVFRPPSTCQCKLNLISRSGTTTECRAKCKVQQEISLEQLSLRLG
jgi:hypothetical protein